MRKAWIAADSIVSPLGLTTDDTYAKIKSGISGLAGKTLSRNSTSRVCVSSFDVRDKLFRAERTRFESIAISAIHDLRRRSSWPSKRTLFILSTTKGNIELLENSGAPDPALLLSSVSKLLAAEAGAEDQIVVSNACTSGVAALLVARRYILSGLYDHAIVVGADVVTEFVVSGFQSLMALSAEPCRPFDAARCGINLGEIASAIFLTSDTEIAGARKESRVAILGGGVSNDANHISGPSKTGEELASAVRKAMAEAGASAEDLGFISAHGTGTLYNDEMEAKAFNLTGLMDIPLHSLKGYIGHTLGGAGVAETVLAAQSLAQQEVISSRGFTSSGVSLPLNICRRNEKKQMRMALKTSSGFGGTNAALVLGLEP